MKYSQVWSPEEQSKASLRQNHGRPQTGTMRKLSPAVFTHQYSQLGSMQQDHVWSTWGITERVCCGGGGQGKKKEKEGKEYIEG